MLKRKASTAVWTHRQNPSRSHAPPPPNNPGTIPPEQRTARISQINSATACATPTIRCSRSGPTSWCGGSGPTNWCGGSGLTSWCGEPWPHQFGASDGVPRETFYLRAREQKSEQLFPLCGCRQQQIFLHIVSRRHNLTRLYCLRSGRLRP